MSQHYREQDANPKLLRGKKIAVLGYGSQGRAHALNLYDSGCDVTVGVREGGPTARQAKADGLKVDSPANAVKDAALVANLFRLDVLVAPRQPGYGMNVHSPLMGEGA